MENFLTRVKNESLKKSDSIEKCGTMSSQIPTGLQKSYANFKLMVIREAEATNNCAAGRKFSVSEVNIRR